MARRIALYGGSFNPPHLDHRRIVEELCRRFDEVVVVPSGPRPDKSTSGEIESVHRAAMVDMTFGKLPRTRVDFSDLERTRFTRTHELLERFSTDGEVWLVVGADLVSGGGSGRSQIQSDWERGAELWAKGRFAVLTREGWEIPAADLPPRHVLVEFVGEISSSEVRDLAYHRRSLTRHVVPEVASYIARYALYRSGIPRRTTSLRISEPRIKLVVDEHNEKALRLADQFSGLVAESDPNLVLVIGGDGTMLHAIRSLWRLRLPFFGVNAGHRGFLLNQLEEGMEGRAVFGDLIVRLLPLLYVEATDAAGRVVTTLAFNDAWVERSSGQAAWLRVRVNGKVCFSRLVADGVLVSTAAGSTAYARAMGATPILVDSPVLLLVGSNVMEPPGWTSAHLSLESVIELECLNAEKRPVGAFADGVELGKAMGMRVRASKIVAVELGFTQDHDMAEKLAQIQFPAV